MQTVLQQRPASLWRSADRLWRAVMAGNRLSVVQQQFRDGDGSIHGVISTYTELIREYRTASMAGLGPAGAPYPVLMIDEANVLRDWQDWGAKRYSREDADLQELLRFFVKVRGFSSGTVSLESSSWHAMLTWVGPSGRPWCCTLQVTAACKVQCPRTSERKNLPCIDGEAGMCAPQITFEANTAHVILVTSDYGFVDWLHDGATLRRVTSVRSSGACIYDIRMPRGRSCRQSTKQWMQMSRACC